jgi:hypothetical protein
MTPEQTKDRTLAAFFAEQAPPVRDLMFEARVAGRVARYRAVATVLALVPWTVAAVALLWALVPMMAPVIEGLGPTMVPAFAILALTALAVITGQAAGNRLSPRSWRVG